MKCNKCGNYVDNDNISFCPTCGGMLQSSNEVSVTEKKKETKFGLGHLVIILIWVIGIGFVIFIANSDYYFYEDSSQVDDLNVKTNEIATRDGETKIIYDNRYENVNIRNSSDVINYIVKDSVAQKENCSSSILAIENEIVNNYGINAVNLCEMDLEFATEIKEVTKYIYDNFPTARGNITNLTLGNVGDRTYMAAFMPIFTFVTSKTNSGYPIGIKTEIILNAKYFLNPKKIKNNVIYGSNSGYFPPNATRSSTVAHEFGHYLSYIALLNSYDVDNFLYVKTNRLDLLLDVNDDFNSSSYSYKMLMEAYDRYVSKYGRDLTFDGFRGTISSYAVAKDSKGNYIYDETIAEAFHDCYLNGDNAKIASKLILEVLKEKL